MVEPPIRTAEERESVALREEAEVAREHELARRA